MYKVKVAGCTGSNSRTGHRPKMLVLRPRTNMAERECPCNVNDVLLFLQRFNSVLLHDSFVDDDRPE